MTLKEIVEQKENSVIELSQGDKMQDVFEVKKTFFNLQDAEKEKERTENLFDPPPKEVWIDWTFDREGDKQYTVYFTLD